MLDTSKFVLSEDEQLKAWVQGESKHNLFDDQCTPDMSCCLGTEYLADVVTRIKWLNAVMANDITTMTIMTIGFINKASVRLQHVG